MSKFTEWFSTYGWAVAVILICAGAFLYFGFVYHSENCVIPKDLFEEGFNVTISDKGVNYEVRKGMICITNKELLKEFYSWV